MKYLAYGMNTNLAEMVLRCPGARSLGPAILPKHEFRFAYHADIIKNDHLSVQGVLWEISPGDLVVLDILEGFPNYYLRKEVTVIHNGGPVQAITYYMAPGHNDTLPSDLYLEKLITGYTEHGIPIDQIQDALCYIQCQNYGDKIDPREYDAVWNYDTEFDSWISSHEQEFLEKNVENG